MPFSAPALFLSTLVLPAVAQFSGGSDDLNSYGGFKPDSITTGTFAILCIWALCYGLLSLWNFIALIIARGHRAPHALLLPTIVFFGWSNALYIALVVLENGADLSFQASLPDLLIPTLRFISNLANAWALTLLFVAIIAVAWNRETALHKATEGKFGGHHPALIVMHVAFASLIFLLGIAAEAYNMDTNVKYFAGDFDRFFGEDALQQRINTGNGLFYSYQSFAILSFIDIVVTSIVLWRGWRKAGISDRVSNLMLYAIVPLYCFMSLFTMIFVIVFSPHGLPDSASLSAFESADLANALLITLCSIAIIVVILVMGVKRAWWGADGVKQQQYWVPQQPQYVAGAQPQAGYYVPPQDASTTQTGYYVPPVQGGQMYSQPMAHAPGSPQPTLGSPYSTTPVPMESSVGGYTPAQLQSQQGGSVPGGTASGYPEKEAKAGMHFASS
ncbi:hypothetical protein C8F01DRAFT_1372337 [Mycena amicta]|nr:hypothetical protein C8F01DRAFT_1372337 [Mycena amicta]